MKFKWITEELKKATPYMLRNDGDLIECSPLHPYIRYKTETVKECLDKIYVDRFRSLKFLYENTQSNTTAENVRFFVNYLIEKGMVDKSNKGSFDIDEETYLLRDGEVDSVLDSINRDLNQEFLRVRTSDMLYGNKNNGIYFRVSSVKFNWFDLIWKLVYTYRNFISDVTIVKDTATFGGKFNPYMVGGKVIERLPIDEFIHLPGNPIIESKETHDIEAINEAIKELESGKTFSESLNYLHPAHATAFYDRIVKDFLEDDIEHILRKTK